MTLYLGIDIGTSGVRAIAIDDAGVVRGQADCELPQPQQHGHAVRQQPKVWWDGARMALSRLLVKVERAQVRAIAVDGTSGTLLVTDGEGVPLSTGLMYNDASCALQVQAIEKVAPGDSAARGPGSALARLMYFQQLHPNARHAVHQADWIAGMLSGRHGMSDENNALKLGYDTVQRRWPHWLSALGIRAELLPEVVLPGTPIARIAAHTASAFDLSQDTLIVAGTTDGVASFLATGAAQIGEAVTSLGSTLVVKVLSNQPVFAPQYGIYAHRIQDAWLVGGASNTGGTALRQFFDVETMRALSTRLQPEHDTGLNYYPLASIGERFPWNDPDMQSRTMPRPEDDAKFFQGLLEGIASVEATAYRRLVSLGVPYPRRVISIGGGAGNEAWSQIRARKLGVPTMAAATCETAYGTALLARRGAADA